MHLLRYRNRLTYGPLYKRLLKQTSFHWVHLVALDGKRSKNRATCVDQTGYHLSSDKTLVEQLKWGRDRRP